jgi:hypothetical protein
MHNFTIVKNSTSECKNDNFFLMYIYIHILIFASLFARSQKLMFLTFWNFHFSFNPELSLFNAFSEKLQLGKKYRKAIFLDNNPQQLNRDIGIQICQISVDFSHKKIPFYLHTHFINLWMGRKIILEKKKKIGVCLLNF